MAVTRPIPLQRDDTLLFIGDSITDCGRRDDPDRLGNGYVKLCHDLLVARNPSQAPNVLNRGIGGDTVVHLAHRWTDDVLAIAPTVLSIKIGVNDVWRQFDQRGPGVPVEAYMEIYRELLDRTVATLPAIKLVLCEPTVLYIDPESNAANEMVRSYVQAVHRLAKEFDATVVRLFEAFDAAWRTRPDLEWAPDGVHPTPLGHMLLARTWLDATGNLS